AEFLRPPDEAPRIRVGGNGDAELHVSPPWPVRAFGGQPAAPLHHFGPQGRGAVLERDRRRRTRRRRESRDRRKSWSLVGASIAPNRFWADDASGLSWPHSSLAGNGWRESRIGASNARTGVRRDPQREPSGAGRCARRPRQAAIRRGAHPVLQ